MDDIFAISSDVLPLETRVLTLAGSEGVSRPYRFELLLLVPHGASERFDAERALDGAASLLFHAGDGSVRQAVHGALASVERVHELAGDALYRAVVVPRLWKLARVEHSRVWVNKTVPQVIEAVLRANGLVGADYTLRLSASYPAREHVCQYHETDLDFVSRWMEREGMFYYFEQGESAEKLVVTDDVASLAPFAREPVRFYATDEDDGSALEALRVFTARRVMVPRAAKVTDYDYAHPAVDVASAADVSPRGAGDVVAHGEDGVAAPDQARRLARVRAQERAAAEVTYHGEGRVFDVRPGYLFELDGHPRAALDARYLATALEHEGSNAAGDEQLQRRLGLAPRAQYRVRLAAVAAGAPYRAPRTAPVPSVRGAEVAVIDAPADSDYAQIDDQGRYLVKFKFDENTGPAGGASTRVRMIQPHAGNPEGFHFPLRKGTEVAVVFVGGDPDRPVIAAVGPNPLTPSPVAEPNATFNVIQTGGENRIEMEDTAGAQFVEVYSPVKKTRLHLGAHHGAGDFRPAHRHNYVSSTDGTGLLHTGGDMDITVGGNKDERVTDAVSQTYKSTQSTTVTGLVRETYDATMTTTVSAVCSEEYGRHSTDVRGAKSERCVLQVTTVENALDEQHGSQTTTNGALLLEKAASHRQAAAASSTQDVGLLLVQSAGPITLELSGGLTITTPMCLFNAATSYTVTTTRWSAFCSATWLTLAPLTLSAFNLKKSTSAFELSLIGTKREVTNIAIGAVGLKIEMNGVKVANKPIGLDFAAFKLNLAALKTRMAGARVK